MIGVIAFARGYRPDFTTGSLIPTGIIATSSSPRASKVYLNGVLKGVTDLNLTLPPGDYNVEVKRDGYHTWSKNIKLKGELVAIVDPVLFPINPSLSPLTNLGIVKAVAVDSTDNVLLFSETGDELKDGIYMFEASKRPLSFLPPLQTLILKKNIPISGEFHLKDSIVTFSPDYKQMIIEFPLAAEGDEKQSFSFIFSTNGENQTPFDTTVSKDSVLEAWTQEATQQNIKVLQTFPPDIAKIASDSFHMIGFSPDKTKLLYSPKESLELPRIIDPPLIASNQTQEERTIQKGKIYVYDKKEDKNFPISYNIDKDTNVTNPSSTPSLVRGSTGITPTPVPLDFDTANLPPVLWYVDSKHLIFSDGKQISAADYDGTNRKTVYSGPFDKSFIITTQDGKITVLANLNPANNPLPDLYLVGIR